MANKAAIAVVLGLGVVGGTIFFATRAKAAPGEFTLTVAEVLASSSMAALEAYYNYMNELYVTKKIDKATYDAFYQAYVTRFYQLVGGA